MGKNWAITIGINKYNNLQTLQFAKRDADLVREYFQKEIEFENIYHFTDDSPPIQQDHGPDLESRPTRSTLRRFLRVRFKQDFLKTGDNLWFYFSGHGVRHEDRDYLMPCDADPGDVKRTAIPLNYVTERLRRSGADNVILLVDACRCSTKSKSGLGIGKELQQGVITMFACSPREISYEIEDSSVQQGAFTYALLQGLRIQGQGNCATVERLNHYLQKEVPKINQRYGKPPQTPYCKVEPLAKSHLILLPQQATLDDVKALKLEALQEELGKQYLLAIQLWIRVLSASLADPDAIEGIERIAQLLVQEYSDPFISVPNPPLEPPFQKRIELDDFTAITAKPITWEMYQQFLYYQNIHKFHSTAQPQTIHSDQRDQPVKGLSPEDQLWFCAWLSSKTSLLKEDVLFDYRPATSKDLKKGGLPVNDHFYVLRQQIDPKYSNLVNHLACADWKEADEETFILMKTTVDQEDWQHFAPEDLINFPKNDLKLIIDLWEKHSNSRFGFRVQRDIYRECGGNLDGKTPDRETWTQFSIKVGWEKDGKSRNYPDLVPSLFLPKGSLPDNCMCRNSDIWARIFFRIECCEL